MRMQDVWRSRRRSSLIGTFQPLKSSECWAGSLIVMESPDDLLRREFEQATSCFAHNNINSFCILCRRHKPRDIVLSHIVPHSVMKSAGKGVHFIGLAGREVGHSKAGYRGYCKSCEGMLSEKGEKHFNQLMHAPLVDNYDSAVHVESKDAAGIYHCAVSVWWRYSTLAIGGLACEKSPKAEVFRKLLERVRVWLHKPSSTLPLGLQVVFVALNSLDLSCLREHRLDLAATRLYVSVTDPETKRIDLIRMGPLNIHFFFTKLSCFQISTPIDIRTGDARQRHPIQGLVECMKTLRDHMLNLEMRASKDKPPSSAPLFPMRNMDMIPQQIATIDSKKVIFHYHRLIRIEMCKTSYGNVQLELYKPKKVKSDDPPYDALATLSNEQVRVRIWLQSDPMGKRFEFHKDISNQLPFYVDVTLEFLRKTVSQLKLP